MMEDSMVHKEHNKILVNLDGESRCIQHFDTETSWNTTTWKIGKKIKRGITTIHLDLRDRMCRQKVREISTGPSPIVSFHISSVEPPGSNIKELRILCTRTSLIL
jgi:hypothetical protein